MAVVPFVTGINRLTVSEQQDFARQFRRGDVESVAEFERGKGSNMAFGGLIGTALTGITGLFGSKKAKQRIRAEQLALKRAQKEAEAAKAKARLASFQPSGKFSFGSQTVGAFLPFAVIGGLVLIVVLLFRK